MGAGQTSLGFGEFFGTSFATAANIGASSVTPKIPRTVVKSKNKDFRLDFGFFLASSKFFLNLKTALFLIFVILLIVLPLKGEYFHLSKNISFIAKKCLKFNKGYQQNTKLCTTYRCDRHIITSHRDLDLTRDSRFPFFNSNSLER